MSQPRNIVFATNNAHKLEEIRRIMGDKWNVMSLNDIGCHDDIPETADALGGAPGVYSARYAGDGHDSAANMAMLLYNLQGIADRRAHFSTVIALVTGEDIRFFEGSVYGVITEEPDGAGGFGYDPVFLPDEDTVTFASMPADRKNAISHRGRATAKLIDYLSSL